MSIIVLEFISGFPFGSPGAIGLVGAFDTHDQNQRGWPSMGLFQACGIPHGIMISRETCEEVKEK